MSEKTARSTEPALRGRSQVRVLQDGGLLACSDAVLRSRRYAATLLVAVTDADFELEIGGSTSRHGVAALRPFVAVQLNARNVPFVGIDLSPEHPLFRAFSAIPGNGCLNIPRARFASLAGALRDFHAGAMPGWKESQRLFHRATNLAATVLPEPAPLDSRVLRVMRLLSHGLPFSVGELARHCCISPDRLSHLLSQELGITLRQYTQWLKIMAAARYLGSDKSLTEIAAAAGFTDSAHFSKVWSQAFGASPAHFFANAEMAIHLQRQASRLNSRKAPKSQERMPTTSV